MQVTIDGAGRVVIPKVVREAVGLVAGATLELRVEGSRIELEPSALAVRVEKKGAVVVAAASPGKLTSETVEAARAALRRGT